MHTLRLKSTLHHHHQRATFLLAPYAHTHTHTHTHTHFHTRPYKHIPCTHSLSSLQRRDALWSAKSPSLPLLPRRLPLVPPLRAAASALSTRLSHWRLLSHAAVAQAAELRAIRRSGRQPLLFHVDRTLLHTSPLFPLSSFSFVSLHTVRVLSCTRLRSHFPAAKGTGFLSSFSKREREFPPPDFFVQRIRRPILSPPFERAVEQSRDRRIATAQHTVRQRAMQQDLSLPSNIRQYTYYWPPSAPGQLTQIRRPSLRAHSDRSHLQARHCI